MLRPYVKCALFRVSSNAQAQKIKRLNGKQEQRAGGIKFELAIRCSLNPPLL